MHVGTNESTLHNVHVEARPIVPQNMSRSSGSSQVLPRRSGHWAAGQSHAPCPWGSLGAAAQPWAPPRLRSGCSRRQERATMTGTARQACCATNLWRVSGAPSHMHTGTDCMHAMRPILPAATTRVGRRWEHLANFPQRIAISAPGQLGTAACREPSPHLTMLLLCRASSQS